MSMLDCPNEFHRENSSFSAFQKNRLHRDRRTDRPTYRPTDTTSYRDARTHLKKEGEKGRLVCYWSSCVYPLLPFKKKTTRRWKHQNIETSKPPFSHTSKTSQSPLYLYGLSSFFQNSNKESYTKIFKQMLVITMYYYVTTMYYYVLLGNILRNFRNGSFLFRPLGPEVPVQWFQKDVYQKEGPNNLTRNA